MADSTSTSARPPHEEHQDRSANFASTENGALEVGTSSQAPEDGSTSRKRRRLNEVSMEDTPAPEPTEEDGSTKPKVGLTRLRPAQAVDRHDPETEMLLRSQGLPLGLAQPLRAEMREGAALDPDLVSDATRARLEKMGIERLFAVQANVVRMLRQTHAGLYPHPVPRDVLVASPTGSGKTLAYAIPLVDALRSRVIPRLRAIVVLPTKDLTAQVAQVLSSVAGGALQVDIAGRKPRSHGRVVEEGTWIQESDPFLPRSTPRWAGDTDILVGTPLAVLEHVQARAKVDPSVSPLQHLRFFILDEADRLLGGSGAASAHNWLTPLLDMLDPPVPSADSLYTTTNQLGSKLALAPAWLDSLGWSDALRTNDAPPNISLSSFASRPLSSCQKLLFSATLTRDPARVAALRLRNPMYLSVRPDGTLADADEEDTDQFAIPDTLKEVYVPTTGGDKPLALYALLTGRIPRDAQRLRSVLCFTKSVEAAERLAQLLSLVDAEVGSEPLRVAHLTATTPPAQRKALLSSFKSGSVDILVCSDVLARGLDLPNTQHVVSYDAPIDLRKYVHRVGRTARAGRSGTAWTLVESQEVYPFRRMRRAAPHAEEVQHVRVHDAALDPLREAYDEALAQLAERYGTGST